MVFKRQRQSIVQIDTPGCRITVSPENLPPIPPPRPREIRGRSRRDVYDWVSHQVNTPITPQVDRRGRVIKPRTRYCPEDEEERQKELVNRIFVNVFFLHLYAHAHSQTRAMGF